MTRASDDSDWQLSLTFSDKVLCHFPADRRVSLSRDSAMRSMGTILTPPMYPSDSNVREALESEDFSCTTRLVLVLSPSHGWATGRSLARRAAPASDAGHWHVASSGPARPAQCPGPLHWAFNARFSHERHRANSSSQDPRRVAAACRPYPGRSGLPSSVYTAAGPSQRRRTGHWPVSTGTLWQCPCISVAPDYLVPKWRWFKTRPLQ